MAKKTYTVPGVYQDETSISTSTSLLTGVPAFLGVTATSPDDGDAVQSLSLTAWPEFEEKFGAPAANSYLAPCVRGFFENGGTLCYVVPIEAATPTALENALFKLEAYSEIDLICAPDIMTNQAKAIPLQQCLLEHCEKTNDRMALLDALPNSTVKQVLDQAQEYRSQESCPDNGALYYPWITVPDETGAETLVPPCGHIAGVYARSDRRIGVHKAPANEVLEGVYDLEVNPTHFQQSQLNPAGVNCLRIFPGRGIRVWGARTISREANWRYVNVRRLFLTTGRWIEHNLSTIVFEPNDTKLWARIVRELYAYLNNLFTQGALKGSSAKEAFYVKCDAEINSAGVRDLGLVIAEIGMAPVMPGEFIVIRITQSTDGINLSEPG